jgi:hydrogenase maturation factor
VGKLPKGDLKRLLRCIKKDPKVVVAPQLGFDSGVHQIDGDRYLVVSTDPCIGVPDDWFGWLLINYVASDIALFGAKMEYCTINLLGPPTTDAEVFQRVMEQACNAANELDVAIVTGHTGTYNGLATLVGVCTGYGHVDKKMLKTPADAHPEDCVMCIKPVGLETAVNFALAHRALAEKLFGVEKARELVKLVTLQSCVKEAMLLAETEGVNAMHDATEGGVTAALNEMAEAAGVGFKVEWKKLPIPKEVQILRDQYRLSDMQVLSISSTGTILAAVSPEAKDEVEKILRQNSVEANVIGFFTKDLRRLLVKNGKEKPFPKEADDPYTRLLSQKPESIRF